jgi:DNA-binding MarR family transcriptional regulator
MTDWLDRVGLSRARAQLLWVLGSDGAVTQRALADTLRVTPRNVTGLVDRLQSDALVARRPHPLDRRASLVELTAHGRDIVADLQRQHAELADLLFAGLPERSVTEFSSALSHVATVIRERLAEAQP